MNLVSALHRLVFFRLRFFADRFVEIYDHLDDRFDVARLGTLERSNFIKDGKQGFFRRGIILFITVKLEQVCLELQSSLMDRPKFFLNDSYCRGESIFGFPEPPLSALETGNIVEYLRYVY